MNIVFPETAEKYAGLQCNGDKTLYENMPEIEHIEKYFKEEPKQVVDLGSGIGRASVHLFKKYGWENTTFHLVDGDGGETQYQSIRKNEREYYNSYQATNDFCRANGLNNYKIHISHENWDSSIIDADIVYSFLAFGFHWPLYMCLQKVRNVLKTGGVAIFGIRGKTSPGKTPEGKRLYESAERFTRNQIALGPAFDFKVEKVLRNDHEKRNSVLVLRKEL